MEFKGINLKRTTVGSLRKLYCSGELLLSKTDLKLLQGIIIQSVSSGDYRVALNSCALSLLVNPNETLETIRRKGLFRYSSYISKKCIVKNLTEELIDFITGTECKNDRLQAYLQSVANFAYVHNEYSRLKLKILNEFRLFSKNYKKYSLIKTLVAHVDYLFLQQAQPPEDQKGNMNSIFSRSKEEVSSATSYLIYLLTLTPSYGGAGSKVADVYITSHEIYRLLLPAALIEDYKEIELLIEHYNYILSKEGANYLLKPPSPNFERDMRLGYIRTETQAINTGMSFVRWVGQGKEILSISQVVETFINIDNFIHFEFVGVNDYPRYRLKMPDFAYKMLYEKLFNDEVLFKEEAYHFAWISGEQLINFESLKEVYISDNLRLFDFFKIKRYFLFMHMVYEQHFKKMGQIEPAHLLHSLVPQLNDEYLDLMFKYLGNPIMIDEFMDVVCWEPDDKQLFDLQYQPVIFLDGQYLIPFNILAQMNSIRNLYASEYKKQNKKLLLDGKVDPLTDKLNRILTKAGVENIVQFNYGAGDIDIVAFLEGNLIFIECKHSLHPGDLYELRRTYDYVKKAEVQLDRALDYYNNKMLTTRLEKAMGRSLNEVKSVLTLIVTSNRILSGNNFRHPVRDINDLDNFIIRGTFITNEGVFSLYKSGCFQFSELMDYIVNDNVALNHMREVLQKYARTYRTSKETLVYETYFVEMESATLALNEFTKTLRMIKKMED